MTGIWRLRNNLTEEMEIYYKLSMEELQETRDISLENEEALTDNNVLNQV